MKRILLVAVSAIALCAHADPDQSTTTTSTTANTSSTQISAVAPTEVPPSDLHVIPMIGMNAMAVKSADNLSKNKNGASVGGLLELGDGMVTFQTGVEFNQYGGQSPAGPITQSVKLNYINIPALGKWNFMNNPQSTVYMKAGLMPGFLVSQKWYVAPDGATHAVGFDLPAVIALGGAIPVTKKASFVIEASYVRSLSFIDGNGPQSNAHNEGLMFNSGVSISL